MVDNSINGLVQYYINSSISVLEINLTRNNSGVYFCNATNDVGFDVKTVEAIVAPICMLHNHVAMYVCIYVMCIYVYVCTHNL